MKEEKVYNEDKLVYDDINDVNQKNKEDEFIHDLASKRILLFKSKINEFLAMPIYKLTPFWVELHGKKVLALEQKT